MKGTSVDRAVTVVFGIAIGGLLSAALALPWMAPLRDYVVNGWTNICAAAVAVSGAFLLWKQQLRAREKTITDTVVIMFDTLMDELNQTRLALDYDGVKLTLENTNPELDFDPSMVSDFMCDASVGMLGNAAIKARSVIDQFHGLQDALPALTAPKIAACLELYGMAAEADRRLPEIKDLVTPRFEVGDIEAAQEYMPMLNIAVSAMAHYLNVLDGGSRNASFYLSVKALHDSVRTMSRDNMPRPPVHSPPTNL